MSLAEGKNCGRAVLAKKSPFSLNVSHGGYDLSRFAYLLGANSSFFLVQVLSKEPIIKNVRRRIANFQTSQF